MKISVLRPNPLHQKTLTKLLKSEESLRTQLAEAVEKASTGTARLKVAESNLEIALKAVCEDLDLDPAGVILKSHDQTLQIVRKVSDSEDEVHEFSENAHYEALHELRAEKVDARNKLEAAVWSIDDLKKQLQVVTDRLKAVVAELVSRAGRQGEGSARLDKDAGAVVEIPEVPE